MVETALTELVVVPGAVSVKVDSWVLDSDLVVTGTVVVKVWV